jgi:thiol-disulfide isomerase/thioredoxin
MARKLTVLVLVFILHGGLFAQTISGHLSLLVKQEIRLEGFNGIKTYPISSMTIDEKGKFQLSYSELDYGVGFLISEDNKPLIVILSGENIEISGEALSYIETLKIVKGKENKWFEQYAKEHPKREQALSAWIYLEKFYQKDSLFLVQKKVNQSIKKEKKRIKDEDADFLKKLPKDSYVSWFLPKRKLISGVSIVAQHSTEEIPATVAAFRKMDYTDQRLYKSGLFTDAIESHFWLIENSGKPLDSVFVEMKVSIDSMFKYLVKDENKLNEVTDHLFLFLESRSLFQASEYLALKVLNEVSCTIDNDLANQLETYRVMKIGNTAPDIVFEGKKMMMGNEISKNLKLSDLKSNYTLVVFGASWCSNCAEEIPKIKEKYIQWKLQGLETVFMSLDNDETEFTNFVKDFPFLSSCDFNGWEGKAVKDYHVFAAPTLFLLDKERKILLRPRSVDQVDAWINYILETKN